MLVGSLDSSIYVLILTITSKVPNKSLIPLLTSRNSIGYNNFFDFQAVNPFQSLPIYGKYAMMRYRSSTKSEQPPHIYALANLTYQSMLHDLETQYIVISGESGSGKTQSANFLVKQLTYLGNAPNKSLQEKILQINPLIEGFGNSRKIINDNS